MQKTIKSLSIALFIILPPLNTSGVWQGDTHLYTQRNNTYTYTDWREQYWPRDQWRPLFPGLSLEQIRMPWEVSVMLRPISCHSVSSVKCWALKMDMEDTLATSPCKECTSRIHQLPVQTTERLTCWGKAVLPAQCRCLPWAIRGWS